MSWYAGFDPQDTQAEPMRIREQAQGFARIAGQLTGQQSSLGYVLRCLAESFSEVLHPLIRDRIGDQVDTLREVVGAVLYAEQVTNGWAEDVVTFKQERASLVQRWESAYANGFGVLACANLEPDMRADLYDSARQSTLTELTREADAAYSALTVAADDRGRQFREGPTVANLLGLMGSGLAEGPRMPILYPDLPVTGPASGLPRHYWGMTPAEIVLATEDDPSLAALLVSRRPDINSPDPFEAALALAVMVAGAGAPGGSDYGSASADRTAAVAQALAGIPPDELALLAAMFPAVVGNLNGMPFDNRIAANRIRIADSLHVARQTRSGLVGAEGTMIQPIIDELDAEIDQYERLLTEPTIDYGNPAGPPWPDYRGRKILYFDPSGDGSWAELVGTIDAETDSVGILVPGVGTDTPDMWNKSNEATEFVAAADRQGDQLAMIVWAGGDFPDEFNNALGEGYAEDLVGPLVDFSYAVGEEIDAQAPGADVPVTVIGHSYGGLTVAMSTISGLSADQLVFVNSPGLGFGLTSNLVIGHLDEYETYAMTVPGDVTPGLGWLAHGLPTALVEGITQLETGVYPDGTPIVGLDGHSGVFEVGSTAWENILAVLTDRPVLVD